MPSMKTRPLVRSCPCWPATSRPAGTSTVCPRIWLARCWSMQATRLAWAMTSVRTWKSDAAAWLDAAVSRQPDRAVDETAHGRATCAGERSRGLRIQRERQVLPSLDPVDAGRGAGRSGARRVPPGQHHGPGLSPLAAGQTRKTVPAVLPVRLEGEGHRVRLGQRRADTAVFGEQVRPLCGVREDAGAGKFARRLERIGTGKQA